MGKPILAVTRSHDPMGALRGAAQRRAGARRHGANPPLHQRPRRLDGVEIVRVGRQEAQRRADAFNQFPHLSRFVRGEIVQDHDIMGAQVPHQVAPHPPDKPWCGHGAPRGRQRQPPVDPDRADERQIVTPVPGARLDEFGAPRQPRMRPAHRHIRTRFIEKDEAPRVYVPDPGADAVALGWDAATILLRGSPAFFLKTYPLRRSARSTLERCTRAAVVSRLYARVSSSVVESGRAAISRCNAARSTGDRQPPPFANGATSPVLRVRWTHRSSVLNPIANRAATSAYVSLPVSYARTARSRKAIG